MEPRYQPEHIPSAITAAARRLLLWHCRLKPRFRHASWAQSRTEVGWRPEMREHHCWLGPALIVSISMLDSGQGARVASMSVSPQAAWQFAGAVSQ